MDCDGGWEEDGLGLDWEVDVGSWGEDWFDVVNWEGDWLVELVWGSD